MSDPFQQRAPEDILLPRSNNFRTTNNSNDNRQSLTWSRVMLSNDSSIPPPRSGAASVVVKGRLYMVCVCVDLCDCDVYV